VLNAGFPPLHTDCPFCLAHRAFAARLAIAALSSGDRFFARTFPPFDPPSLPSATADGFLTFTGVGNFRTALGFSGVGLFSCCLIGSAMLRRLGTKPLWHDIRRVVYFPFVNSLTTRNAA